MCFESDCPIWEPQDSVAPVSADVTSPDPNSDAICFLSPLNDGTTSIQAVPREVPSAMPSPYLVFNCHAGGA